MIDKRLKLILLVVLVFVGICGESRAASLAENQKSDKPKPIPFEVTGAALHADAPHAEICLTLSRPIDVRDRARLASFLYAKKDGKKLKISPTDLSLTPQDVCLQNLDHRHTYALVLQRLQSLDGKKLAQKYSVTMTVPDRKAVLTFVGDSRRLVLPRHVRELDQNTADDELMRAGVAHVVRSVNVMATHLTLYKVADRKLFPQAWQQFKQINLSPSESLYFCREKGEIVFESDLVFGESPNQDQMLVAPLPPEKELASGLYYLAATPRGKGGSNPGLFAGQWFLVSDLRLGAARVRNGIKISTSQGRETLQVQPDVLVAALDKAGKPLAEAKTSADGTAFLPLSPNDLERVAVVTGQMSSGDVDLFELGSDRIVATNDISLNALITTDRSVYRSGASSIVTLRAENATGEAQAVGESLLQLKTSTKKVYSQKIVPAGKVGLHLVKLSLPDLGIMRTWFVSWLRKDGSLLAEKPIVISPQGDVTNLSVEIDRTSIDLQSPTYITIKSVDSAKKPVAAQNGTLIVRTARPEVRGWLDYHFGDVIAQTGGQIYSVPFATGGDGTARVTVDFDSHAQEGLAGTEGLSFVAELDNGSASSPVTLPVRLRSDALVGVKLHSYGRAFPENSVAQFDVIAVDAAGKRRALGDLYYLVYEEGRSFEWVPSDGHWDYRQRPDHRRVGGGVFTISASGENSIRWPVTSGHYVLEVTTAAGEILSRSAFDVGRRDEQVLQQDESKIHFADPTQILEMKSANSVNLFLSEPSMVSLLVTDGTIRDTQHRFMKAGMNAIEITPAEGWGHQVLVRAVAQSPRSFELVVAQQTMMIHVPANDLTVKILTSAPLVTGKRVILPLQILKAQRNLPSFVSVVATPQPADGASLAPVLLERVPVNAEGKADLRLTLPEFEGVVRLSIIAWNDTQKGELVTELPVHPALAIEADIPSALSLGDKRSARFSLTNYAQQIATFAYTVNAPKGLLLSGKTTGTVTLRKGQKKVLPVVFFTVREPADGDLVLTLAGSNGQSAVSRAWSVYAGADHAAVRTEQEVVVEPNQDYALPVGKPGKGFVMLVSPLPMKGVLQSLDLVLRSEPQTTADIAQWIDVMQV
ncbi:MAG: hypothetical protein PHD48_11675, partial [Alphaproteobacteria bacterium]|nr:hypothetical protein [Alphaproteobacteria bacterium]